MIRSFRNKGLAEFWRTGRAAGIPPELAVRVRNRLTALHRASDLGRLREAGNFAPPPLEGRGGRALVDRRERPVAAHL